MRKKYLSIVSIIPFLTSCASRDDVIFYLDIKNDKDNFKVYKEESLDLEIYDNSLIGFNIPKRIEVNESNSKNLLSFKYDKDKFNLKYLHNTYTNKIYYSLQSKSLFENESFIVNFDNKDYRYKINSLKPSRYTLLNKDSLSSYKEFKEMIDSIKYYNYGSNYPGLPSWGQSSYLGNSFYYSFNDAYSLDYLKYLKDDCFYPSLFDFASPNVTYKEFSMNFDNSSDIKENSIKHTMCNYKIEMGVIDPGCTKPSNPLRMMSFEAVPLNYKSDIEYLNELINDKLNEHYYLLSKEYEDLFLNYKVNDLNIRLLIPKDNKIVGYFEDSNYSYRVSATYFR